MTWQLAIAIGAPLLSAGIAWGVAWGISQQTIAQLRQGMKELRGELNGVGGKVRSQAAAIQYLAPEDKKQFVINLTK